MKYLIKNKKDKERGVALLLTIVILSIIVLSSIFIVDIAVAQLRLASDINDSAEAIYAADSGIEWQLYQIIKNKTTPLPIMLNGAEVSTEIISTSPNYVIRSLGSSNLVKRQLEVNF
jgi:hypothetical protein